MKIHSILAALDNDPMRKNDPFMPLSLPLLAGSAPDHDYTFTDMLWEDAPDTTLHYDLVGISARHTAEAVAYTLADQFRERGVKVILGGAQISMLPFESLQHADAVVIGEAESLWPIILTDLAKGRLQSFYVCSPDRFDSKGLSCYQHPCLPDLDNKAIPLRNIKFTKKSIVLTPCLRHADVLSGVISAVFRNSLEQYNDFGQRNRSQQRLTRLKAITIFLTTHKMLLLCCQCFSEITGTPCNCILVRSIDGCILNR
jgi:hypothetical protein